MFMLKLTVLNGPCRGGPGAQAKVEGEQGGHLGRGRRMRRKKVRGRRRNGGGREDGVEEAVHRVLPQLPPELLAVDHLLRSTTFLARGSSGI